MGSKSLDIKVQSDSGKGRAFVVLSEGGVHIELPGVVDALADFGRTIHLCCATIDDGSWARLTESLRVSLEDLKIRQASFVVFGAAGTLIQNLYLHHPKLIRSVVYVDVTTRAHPSLFARAVDSLETMLPLGLPLRSMSKGFDGKPFLQRLRCPTLVVVSSKATPYQREQAQVLAKHIPTSWHVELPQEGESQVLCQLVRDFRDVPAKCPQKSLRAEA